MDHVINLMRMIDYDNTTLAESHDLSLLFQLAEIVPYTGENDVLMLLVRVK